MKKNIIWVIIVLVAFLVVAVSFFVTKEVTVNEQFVTEYDKATPVYRRAENFVRNEEYSKAENAFLTVVNDYPESIYAENSRRNLIEIYRKNKDYKKVRDNYKRLMREFPDIADSAEVKAIIEDLNLQIMFSPDIAENSVEYEVLPGDTLYKIAKNFNTTVELLKKANGIEKDLIRPGQKLKIIVSEFSIFVDKSQNILLLKNMDEIVKSYQVSTGKNNSTPVGVFRVEEKMVQPVWYKIGSVVSPDSDEYELGSRWMGLSVEGYGIHGTSDESTIGQQVTLGCVRMRNDDVVELFTIIPSGTKVTIVN
ncbi:MAG: L,D-transpeptidase family protein [Candidatus Omnitrophota bacterium]|nr:L,D-transpeptidase family protein [Candidatus Omnitrophota bacterium]MBU1894889.1 L,D-transpeptidase family protein [Candidatus Omnitrophota bacterium]